jgi:hypothetical protein
MLLPRTPQVPVPTTYLRQNDIQVQLIEVKGVGLLGQAHASLNLIMLGVIFVCCQELVCLEVRLDHHFIYFN